MSRPPQHPALPLRSLCARLAARGLLRSGSFAAEGEKASRNVEVSAAPTSDSRLVMPGAIFVAIKGATRDGAEFCADAVDRGAVALIAEHAVTSEPSDAAGTASTARGVPVIEVTDARAALAECAAWWEGDPADALITIGVTGTDGKTTTSTLLATALTGAGLPAGLVSTALRRVGGRQEATPAHQTTPEAPELQAALRASLDAGDRAAVVEATSHGLALDRVGAIPFAAGIVTNLTVDHLDFHGSFEAYRAAKLRLVSAIRQSSASAAAGLRPVIVLPVDDPAVEPFAEAAVEAGIDIRRFGVTGDGHLLIDGAVHRVDLAMPGRVNALNAAAALTLIAAWGLPLAAAIAALAAEPGPPGRAERIDEGQPFSVLVDFAHTGASMRAIMEIARSLRAPAGRLLIVTGAAGERDPGRRSAVGGAVASADAIWIADEDPRFEDPDGIARAIVGAIVAARGSGSPLAAPIVLHDRRAAISAAIAAARPGDVVLLAGKGHERTIERRGHDEPWDEAAVAREALHALGYSRER